MNTPKTHVVIALSFLVAACDGAVGPAGPPGPQGEPGPEGPAGEAGNANVTLYEFPGHDFASGEDWYHCFQNLAKSEWENSLWKAYFHYIDVSTDQVVIASTDELEDYELTGLWNIGQAPFDCAERALEMISYGGGTGANVSQIHLLRVAPTIVENCWGQPCLRTTSPYNLELDLESLIPPGLDLSDYDAVVDHFDLTENDIVRM